MVSKITFSVTAKWDDPVAVAATNWCLAVKIYPEIRINLESRKLNLNLESHDGQQQLRMESGSEGAWSSKMQRNHS